MHTEGRRNGTEAQRRSGKRRRPTACTYRRCQHCHHPDHWDHWRNYDEPWPALVRRRLGAQFALHCTRQLWAAPAGTCATFSPAGLRLSPGRLGPQEALRKCEELAFEPGCVALRRSEGGVCAHWGTEGRHATTCTTPKALLLLLEGQAKVPQPPAGAVCDLQPAEQLLLSWRRGKGTAACGGRSQLLLQSRCGCRLPGPAALALAALADLTTRRPPAPERAELRHLCHAEQALGRGLEALTDLFDRSRLALLTAFLEPSSSEDVLAHAEAAKQSLQQCWPLRPGDAQLRAELLWIEFLHSFIVLLATSMRAFAQSWRPRSSAPTAPQLEVLRLAAAETLTALESVDAPAEGDYRAPACAVLHAMLSFWQTDASGNRLVTTDMLAQRVNPCFGRPHCPKCRDSLGQGIVKGAGSWQRIFTHAYLPSTQRGPAESPRSLPQRLLDLGWTEAAD